MLDYRRIDTTTIEDLKEAERLHAAGWKQIQVTPFSILFERKTPRRAGQGTWHIDSAFCRCNTCND